MEQFNMQELYLELIELRHTYLEDYQDIYTDILDNTIDDAAAKMGKSF